jgi:hypothetical protein
VQVFILTVGELVRFDQGLELMSSNGLRLGKLGRSVLRPYTDFEISGGAELRGIFDSDSASSIQIAGLSLRCG